MTKKNMILLCFIAVIVLVNSVTVWGCIQEQKNLDALHRNGEKKLRSIVHLKDYREKEQKEIKQVIAVYMPEVKTARTEKDEDRIINKAKEEIKPLKTDAQYKKAESREKAKKERIRKKKLAAKRRAAELARERAAQTQRNNANNYSQRSYQNNYSQRGSQKSYSKRYSGKNSNSAKPNSNSRKNDSSGSKNSEGCVGENADNFY